MGRKFLAASNAALLIGTQTVIAAPAAGTENFLRKVEIERLDTATDVTLIFKNNATTPRELLKRWTLNSDAGKIILEFNDETEVGIGDGLAFIVDASVGGKAAIRVEYRRGSPVAWPS
jgi:predicted secreted protein